MGDQTGRKSKGSNTPRNLLGSASQPPSTRELEARTQSMTISSSPAFDNSRIPQQSGNQPYAAPTHDPYGARPGNIGAGFGAINPSPFQQTVPQSIQPAFAPPPRQLRPLAPRLPGTPQQPTQSPLAAIPPPVPGAHTSQSRTWGAQPSLSFQQQQERYDMPPQVLSHNSGIDRTFPLGEVIHHRFLILRVLPDVQVPAQVPTL